MKKKDKINRKRFDRWDTPACGQIIIDSRQKPGVGYAVRKPELSEFERCSCGLELYLCNMFEFTIGEGRIFVANATPYRSFRSGL
jgi:hypothetical protein